jgi:DNA-binding transcriptional ArsR family regulator
VQAEPATLDHVFRALSDRTRRDVLEQLGRARSATVTELAQPHGMSLPGFVKHLRVLENAELVTRSKEGRVVRCELAAKPMQQAAKWLAHYERFWNQRLYHREQVSPWTGVASTKSPASRSPGSIRSRPKTSGVRGPVRKR